MNSLSPSDKLSLVAFLQSATAGLARLKATEPLVGDDGLKSIVETSIRATEGQIKGVQEFCQAHGLA